MGGVLVGAARVLLGFMCVALVRLVAKAALTQFFAAAAHAVGVGGPGVASHSPKSDKGASHRIVKRGEARGSEGDGWALFFQACIKSGQYACMAYVICSTVPCWLAYLGLML